MRKCKNCVNSLYTEPLNDSLECIHKIRKDSLYKDIVTAETEGKECPYFDDGEISGFSSFKKLMLLAKEKYNAENFTNGNNSSFLEIVDWRK